MENIFTLYVKSGCKLGFMVHKESWSSEKVAKVIYIDDVIDGEMINGVGPYYYVGYPRKIVMVASWAEGGYYETESGGIWSWELR